MNSLIPEKIRAEIAKGKAYTLIFLKEGPKRDHSEAEADQIQAEHLKYLFGLKEKGVLVINGPFKSPGPLKGLSIYNLADKNAAIALASADPAVKAGRLIVEAHEWFSIPGATLP